MRCRYHRPHSSARCPVGRELRPSFGPRYDDALLLLRRDHRRATHRRRGDPNLRDGPIVAVISAIEFARDALNYCYAILAIALAHQKPPLTALISRLA